MKTNLPCYQHQQGAVLIMSLILLVVLTFVGISALDNTKLQTRMAANTRTSNCAFQVANTGLDQLFNFYSPKEQREKLTKFPTTFAEDLEFPYYSDDTGVATIQTMQLSLAGSSGSSTSNHFLVKSQGTCNEHSEHHVTLLEGWDLEGAADTTSYEEFTISLPVPVPLCNNGLEGSKPECPVACEQSDVDKGDESKCSPWNACYAKYYPDKDDSDDDDENTDLGDAENCVEAIANRCSNAQKTTVGCNDPEVECENEDSSILKDALCKVVPDFCQQTEHTDKDGEALCVAFLSEQVSICDNGACSQPDEDPPQTTPPS